MQKSHTIVQFISAAVIVAIIGGFTGWYFFIKGKVQDVEIAQSGRGFGTDASFGGTTGSTYSNIAGEAPGTSVTTSDQGKPAPRLWQITKTPVAGYGYDSDTNRIFFVERATGNILLANPDLSTIQRLTNTLMPKVYEAHFSRTGDVVLHTLSDTGALRTFAGFIATTSDLTATSTPNTLAGSFLPQSIVATALSNHQPTSKGILALIRTPSGSTISLIDWKTGKGKEMYVSPLAQWQLQRLSSGAGVITQSAADNIPGYSFMVKPDGAVRGLIQNEPGLSVLHHDTEPAFLFSTSVEGIITLFVQTTADSQPMALPISTIAEKCVWAPGGGLIAYCAVPDNTKTLTSIDAWYQGASHTTDTWWKIEATTATAERFFSMDTRTSFDVEYPQMDESGGYIGFQNRVDESLWALRITK